MSTKMMFSQHSAAIKRTSSLAFMLLLALFCFASAPDSLSSVAFESYVQGEFDSEGAISLKNNTRQQIHNVSFRLTYLDMKDKPLDYKDYTVNVEIEPGMTKQVSIPGYQADRSFAYYLSCQSYTEDSKKFKVQYKLLGYNQKAKAPVEKSSYKSDPDVEPIVHTLLWLSKFFVIACVFMLIVGILLFVLVGVEAKRLNREVAPWVLISFFISPIVSLIILLILGKSRDKLGYGDEL